MVSDHAPGVLGGGGFSPLVYATGTYHVKVVKKLCTAQAA